MVVVCLCIDELEFGDVKKWVRAKDRSKVVLVSAGKTQVRDAVGEQ
jgi:hypothetical protein